MKSLIAILGNYLKNKEGVKATFNAEVNLVRFYDSI